MSSQKNETRDDGRLGKYFHALPNMADDDLDPYQYRLYGHYKRVCGVSEDGACWESTRTTATNTKMSVGKVAKSRRELETLGYVNIEERGTNSLRITLSDVMPENIARFSKRSPHEHGVHHMNDSVHDMKQRRTNQEEPIKKVSVAPKTARVSKPKTKADTVRSKPLSYAEQHPELSQAELDAIRRKAIEDSTAQTNREIARQRNFNALEQVVKILPGVSGKLATQYAHMLNGTATKGVYAEYRIEGGITAVEFETFVGWYCIKYPTQGLPKEVEKLYGYVNEWVDAGKPAAPASNGANPLAGFKEYTGKVST